MKKWMFAMPLVVLAGCPCGCTEAELATINQLASIWTIISSVFGCA
ncbi:MAG: hypothetical protein GX616_24900 [Planctomycetes bacterium]|nr:hypothetical protein [Planctomycetota bacterium]